MLIFLKHVVTTILCYMFSGLIIHIVFNVFWINEFSLLCLYLFLLYIFYISKGKFSQLTYCQQFKPFPKINIIAKLDCFATKLRCDVVLHNILWWNERKWRVRKKGFPQMYFSIYLMFVDKNRKFSIKFAYVNVKYFLKRHVDNVCKIHNNYFMAYKENLVLIIIMYLYVFS